MGYRVSWQALKHQAECIRQPTWRSLGGSITLPAEIHELGLIRGLELILGGAIVWWGKGRGEWASHLCLTLSNKNKRVKHGVHQHFDKL